MTSNTTTTLWQVTAEAAPDTPQLVEDLKLDVLVIGAGYTGLSTALHLAQANTTVAVMESNQIGHGGSGRNMGQVNAGFLLLPQQVVSHLGPELGERMNHAFSRSTQLVFKLIEQYQIFCNLERNGNLFLAHNARSRKLIQAFFTQHSDLGAKLEWLEEEKTQEAVGSPRYTSAVLDYRAGTIQPLSYVRGLARAAISEGARVHCNTKIMDLKPSHYGWLATTENGHGISAKQVVLATDSYTDGLWPSLAKSLIPVTAQQVATTPLSENVARTIVPHGRGTADRMIFTHYFRKDVNNRLLMVTGGPSPSPTSLLNHFFPQLGDNIRYEYQWNGQVSVSKDKLPRIYKAAPNLLAVMGYSGRGISSGTLMGKLISDHLLREEDLPVPTIAIERRYFPGIQRVAANLLLDGLRRLDNFDKIRL